MALTPIAAADAVGASYGLRRRTNTRVTPTRAVLNNSDASWARLPLRVSSMLIAVNRRVQKVTVNHMRLGVAHALPERWGRSCAL